MKSFKGELTRKLQSSIYNNYGIENYDEARYGKHIKIQNSLLSSIKYIVKKIIKWKKRKVAEVNIQRFEKYLQKLQILWENLNPQDKLLMVDIISYRLLGYEKIILPTNNSNYWKSIATAQSLIVSDEKYDPHFLGMVLEKFDLKRISFDVKLFFTPAGIAIDFINEQYAYKLNGKNFIEVEKGDVVLDIGACWGDTALYFASKIGPSGKVYSFEFIPDNIKLFNLNLALNPSLSKNIELVPHPASNKSNDVIYYRDNGPGSRIEKEQFDGQTGSTTTVSIDEFVKMKNITKLDYIKMDIEGAEPIALEGAIETIKKFRPKLAIAIYHSMDDFVNIPNWIMNLNLGYEIYLGHYTIHHEETVIFAKQKIE